MSENFEHNGRITFNNRGLGEPNGDPDSSLHRPIQKTANLVACPFRKDSLPGQIPAGSRCRRLGENLNFSRKTDGKGRRIIVLQRPENCPIISMTKKTCEVTPINASKIIAEHPELRSDSRLIQ